ncbi:hypothetical protein Anapl_00337 [Anas platyrhynchos]|uniref:Uncharacterized protein n=1 Tax=Anas platyrhynchos TaxID=8839 RepID=R0JU44_ANAPL|nr:uncharacterized protein LOC101797781 isoform X2 [Anas platyrhynchos]EOB00991.1 hypothetical protein Anapl_00337 [Anas platyrhynchos]|eukprot:XP_027321479.1 uncharacterized protein LOC101797781 isoform X3 [Anas platyrhynchos]
MSTLLLRAFLPLLLLAWLPAGLTQQHLVPSVRINVSELSWQRLLQMVSNCTDQTMKQSVDQIKNMMKKVEIVEIRMLYGEKHSAVGSMNETKTATCTCEMSNTTGVKDETNKTQHELGPETSPTSSPEHKTYEGKSESKHVEEMSQLSTPQNEEVMYAKLKFEKTETKPAPASEVVYAEIKSQQK